MNPMHLIAGFESQIAARGGALALVQAACERGVEVRGAALARRDTERAVHVNPLRGFALPEHVMGALDDVVDGTTKSRQLAPGETAFVVAIAHASTADVTSLVDGALLGPPGALWVDVQQVGGLAHQTGN